MFKELNKPPAPNTEATSASTSEKIYVRPLTADDRAAVLSIAEKTGIASPILDEVCPLHPPPPLYPTLRLYTTSWSSSPPPPLALCSTMHPLTRTYAP